SAGEGNLLGPRRRVWSPDPKAGDSPADTPQIVGRIEGGYFDESAREIYVTDSYLRGRVLVYNMDTMAFKRGWGAYGKPLKDIPVNPTPVKYDPKAPPAKDFIAHLTVAVSKDGLVYAADRQ